MRRIPLTLVLVLFAFPAAALAGADATGDGSLAVTGANAKSIIVQGRGLIYGNVDSGSVTIIDFVADDTNQFRISGSTSTKMTSSGSPRVSGTGIRFWTSGSSYTLKFEGTGIGISAVGKGTVTATGAGTLAPAAVSTAAKSSVSVATPDGVLAVNGGKAQPLSKTQITAQFGVTK